MRSIDKNKDSRKFSKHMLRGIAFFVGVGIVSILIDVLRGKDINIVLSLIISGIVAVVLSCISWFVNKDKSNG